MALEKATYPRKRYPRTQLLQDFVKFLKQNDIKNSVTSGYIVSLEFYNGLLFFKNENEVSLYSRNKFKNYKCLNINELITLLCDKYFKILPYKKFKSYLLPYPLHYFEIIPKKVVKDYSEISITGSYTVNYILEKITP